MKEALTTSKLGVIIKNLGYIPAFIIGIGLNFDAILILSCFMVIDTLLGVVRSVVIHGGNSFRSRLLAHGIVSKMLILFIPTLLVYTGRGSGINFLPFAEGTISILVLAEAYSILGHIQSIRTGEDVKEYDAVSLILKNIRKSLEKILASSDKP